jgi:hypothetical protein
VIEIRSEFGGLLRQSHVASVETHVKVRKSKPGHRDDSRSRRCFLTLSIPTLQMLVSDYIDLVILDSDHAPMPTVGSVHLHLVNNGMEEVRL